MFRIAISVIVLLACILGVIAGVVFLTVSQQLPQLPERLEEISMSPPTEIYASDGSIITVLGGRQQVPFSRISPNFLNAVVAAEDKNYWSHHGLDKRALLRAAYHNILHGRIVQGGSTITQQLAKNMFFSTRRDWQRKIRDMLMALQIERRFSKEKILEAYCNQNYFGSRAFGVEAAAQTFFSKHADRLTLAEASMLAGMPNSPSRYNPYANYEAAKDRQRFVLNRMVAEEIVTQEKADSAFQDSLIFQPMYREVQCGSYFVDYVLRSLEDELGRDITYHGGLKIFTTLNPQYQQAAEDAVRQGLEDLDQLTGNADREDLTPDQQVQAALVAIDPGSGAILAMVGGRSYGESEYNRALSTQRQPGSSFKPILYLAALDGGGFTPKSVVLDSAVVFRIPGSTPWKPRNFDMLYRGPMVLKQALARSINVIAAKVMGEVGPEPVIEAARKLGIHAPLEPNLSLALGSSPVPPLEMASAFGTIANGGTYFPPVVVTRIEDRTGEAIREHFFSGTREYDPETLYPLLDMLKGVLDCEAGTGRVVRRMGFSLPAAGKTGTTNDYKDAWFTGFTPNLVASVWVGYDRRRELRDSGWRGITGARGAAPIWARFMIEATEGQPPREFSIPKRIRFEWVDVVTGLPSDSTTRDSIRVALYEEEVATR
jgi:1A family penicillin-binding protein